MNRSIIAGFVMTVIAAWTAPSAPASAQPAINRAAATLNSNFYNVIAPTFSTGGNSSFIRLGNSGATATTFTITVVGAPSGAIYGSGTVQVPAGASPQYSLSAILSAAGAGALANGDTSYSLYMQDPDPSLSYQHVIYNGGNGFFENVGECHFASSQDYSGLNTILYNVHTSQLAGYPAQIYIHNYATTAATYNVAVSDNNTGSVIGTVPVTIQANSTISYPFSYFEQQLKWTPSSAQQHANMTFSPAGSATPQVEVGDYIYNQQFSAYVNMTQRCGFVSGVSTVPTTTLHGTIVGQYQTGSITVIVQGSLTGTSVLQATAILALSNTTTVALTGSYNPSGNTLTLSGSGYAVTGTVSGDQLTGTFTGPSNTTGAIGAQNETVSRVTPYCGTFSSGQDTGLFNIQISASGVLTGESVCTSGNGCQPVSLSGQVVGSSFSGTTNDGPTISGTVGNGQINGTLGGFTTFKTLDGVTHQQAVSGSFSGSTANCTGSSSPTPAPQTAATVPLGIIYDPNPENGLYGSVAISPAPLNAPAPCLNTLTPCTYASGTTVTLTATPLYSGTQKSGAVVHWVIYLNTDYQTTTGVPTSSECAATSNTCTIVMDKNKIVHAQFRFQ